MAHDLPSPSGHNNLPTCALLGGYATGGVRFDGASATVSQFGTFHGQGAHGVNSIPDTRLVGGWRHQIRQRPSDHRLSRTSDPHQVCHGR